MREKCRVLKKLSNHLYEVQILSDSAQCNTCSLKGSCANQGKILTAFSEATRKPGEELDVEIQEKDETLRALLVFFLPLFLAVVGATVFYQVIFPRNAPVAGAAFAGILLLSFFLLRFADRRAGKGLPKIMGGLEEKDIKQAILNRQEKKCEKQISLIFNSRKR